MSSSSPIKRATDSFLRPGVENLDERRSAPWLLSPYSADIWILADAAGSVDERKVDFRYRMADGRCLTECDSLHRTVKEFAWWSHKYSMGRNSAEYLAARVKALQGVAHALSMAGIRSFADIDGSVIRELSDRCSFGLDGLIQGYERINRYLEELQLRLQVEPMADGGLPRYVMPDGQIFNYVDFGKVLVACNLPKTAVHLPRVRWCIERAARQANLWKSDTPLAECPSPTRLTASAMARYLVPVEQLFEWRHRIEADTPTFPPFEEGAHLAAEVRGGPLTRTPTPPPSLALKLLEQAAIWVVDYAPLILSTNAEASKIRVADLPKRAKHRAMDKIAEGLPSDGPPGGPWPVQMRGRARGPCPVASFGGVVHRLSVACWIVLAGFSARRVKELVCLEVGCIRGDAVHGWWLHVYIAKTLQEKQWIPVPGIVALAIQVLTDLSEVARKASGSPRLFQWLSPFTNDVELPPTALRPKVHLNDFAERVGASAHLASDGIVAHWHWSSHQLRRFFAILYFYRFEGAQLEVISHYLRHFNLEMTRVYLTKDPEVQALWLDTEWGYTGDLVREIVAGGRRNTGGMAERLSKAAKRIVKVLRSRLQVVTPERVGTALKLLLENKGVVLTPKPWVTCTCPATERAALTARCRKESRANSGAKGPDFAHAGPGVCARCPWAYINESRKPFIERELKQMERSLAALGTNSMLAGLQEAAIANIAGVTFSEKAGVLQGADKK